MQLREGHTPRIVVGRDVEEAQSNKSTEYETTRCTECDEEGKLTMIDPTEERENDIQKDNSQ